jgi:uncharacterized protein
VHYTLTAYLLAVCSALLIGFSKTGMPGVSIPAILLMAEAFPTNARLSVVSILPILLVGDVFAVVWFHHHAQWSKLWRLFPWVLPGMIPGIFVFSYFGNDNGLRPWIGWLVMLMLAIELWRRRREKLYLKNLEFSDGKPTTLARSLLPAELKTLCAMCELEGISPCENCSKLERGKTPEIFPHATWFIACTGFLAGFSTFLANAAMPLMSVYLISQGFNKREFLGTAAWFFFLLNLSKVPVYGAMGLFEPWMFSFDLWLVVPTLLGAVLGILFLRHIPQRLFNVLALLLAGAAAIKLIVK